MKQIIISIAGTLLILKIVKIILPEGAVKKYASFIVSALVMLMLLVSISGIPIKSFSFQENSPPDISTEKLENVRYQQIIEEFTRQLDEDMKKTIPELKTAKLLFEFEISENNTGYVTSMTIISPYDENEYVINRISELYMIDSEIIDWRKK